MRHERVHLLLKKCKYYVAVSLVTRREQEEGDDE